MCVCVVACMCMCGDQVVHMITHWLWWADSLFLPAYSSSQSRYQCCTYCSPTSTLCTYKALYSSPGCTIAITTTRAGSNVRTCTSCRIAGEWWSAHMRATELKRRMSTVLDKCTLLTCNNMTTLYFIKQQDLLVEI